MVVPYCVREPGQLTRKMQSNSMLMSPAELSVTFRRWRFVDNLCSASRLKFNNTHRRGLIALIDLTRDGRKCELFLLELDIRSSVDIKFKSSPFFSVATGIKSPIQKKKKKFSKKKKKTWLSWSELWADNIARWSRNLSIKSTASQGLPTKSKYLNVTLQYNKFLIWNPWHLAILISYT